MSVSAGTPVVVELPRDSTLELHSFSANTIFTYTRAAFKLMVQAGDQRVGLGLLDRLPHLSADLFCVVCSTALRASTRRPPTGQRLHSLRRLRASQSQVRS
jgi:hypothetical protein